MGDSRRAVCAVALVGLVAAMAAPAGAQQRDEEARTAYIDGKLAYESKRYAVALEHFKRSYTLSGQAALLYNIASTQQQLNHPGLAAEALRDFLKARPEDPDRADLEERIATLDKAQRLIDREADDRRRVGAGVPGWLSETDADRRIVAIKERERRRRRALAIGLGVGLGVIAAGAITIGALCGTGHCSGSEAHDFDFGKVPVSQ